MLCTLKDTTTIMGYLMLRDNKPGLYTNQDETVHRVIQTKIKLHQGYSRDANIMGFTKQHDMP